MSYNQNFLRTGRSLREYSNPNDSYSPSANVIFGHKLSGSNFETFLMDDFSYSGDPTSANAPYITQVLFKPAVIFVAGILSFIIISLIVCCRCCFRKCRSKEIPDIDDENVPIEITKPIKYKRLCLNVFIIFFCILVLVSDMIVYLGNDYLNTGLLSIQEIMNFLIDLTKSMIYQSDDLSGYGDNLETSYSSAKLSCTTGSSELSSLQTSIDTYTTSVNSFSNQLPSLKTALRTVLDNVTNYAIYYRTIGMYIVWSLAIVSVLLIATCKLFNTSCGMKFALLWSFFSFIIIVILGFIWMFITSLMADFCMTPLKNLILSLPDSNGGVSNIANYYASCGGTNILGDYLNKASNATSILSQTLSSITTVSCPGDVNIQAMKTSLTSMSSTLLTMSNTINCKTINKKFFTIVNENICVNVYDGFLYIWASQLVTSFLLFVLICCVLYSLRYYNSQPYVAIDKDDEEGEEEEQGVDEGGSVVHDGDVAFDDTDEEVNLRNKYSRHGDGGDGDGEGNTGGQGRDDERHEAHFPQHRSGEADSSRSRKQHEHERERDAPPSPSHSHNNGSSGHHHHHSSRKKDHSTHSSASGGAAAEEEEEEGVSHHRSQRSHHSTN